MGQRKRGVFFPALLPRVVLSRACESCLCLTRAIHSEAEGKIRIRNESESTRTQTKFNRLSPLSRERTLLRRSTVCPTVREKKWAAVVAGVLAHLVVRLTVADARQLATRQAHQAWASSGRATRRRGLRTRRRRRRRRAPSPRGCLWSAVAGVSWTSCARSSAPADASGTSTSRSTAATSPGCAILHLFLSD